MSEDSHEELVEPTDPTGPAESSLADDVAAVEETGTDSSPGEAPAGEEPVDLSQLEAAIRARLKHVVDRAKACQAAAESLGKRAKPVLQTRKAMVALTDPENRQVGAMSQAERKRSEAEAAEVHAVVRQMRQATKLRRELVAGLRDSWLLMAGAQVLPAEHWFEAVADNRVARAERFEHFENWLAVGEKRWRPSGRPETTET